MALAAARLGRTGPEHGSGVRLHRSRIERSRGRWGAMGKVAKACWGLTLSLGWSVRAEIGWFARGTGDRGRCAVVASISGAGTALQIGTIDRPRGAGAGIAVRRTETKYDHRERQWERHDVSQENG